MKQFKSLRRAPGSTRRVLVVVAVTGIGLLSVLVGWNRVPTIQASGPDGDSTSHTVFLPLVEKSHRDAAAASPIDGSTANCTDFILSIAGIDVDIPDPGWVWVNPAQKFRSVSGVVTRSRVTYTDFPANHDSHDQNTDILVDPGQEDILSDVNKPNDEDPVSSVADLLPPTTIEVEWEIGTYPSETSSDPERTFPKWVWPSVGDRVWANGHWIFDCGHGKDVGGVAHYRTEIHPPRAFASMHDQVRTLPGTGTTPVPVTATDLYIHGRAGFVVDVLNCGMDIIIAADPDACPIKSTPIDENFEFDIPVPPKPSPGAVLAVYVENGAGNTIHIAPVLQPTPAADPTDVHVTIPLAGSGVSPTAVYARKIYVGWAFPPDPPLRRFKLTLNRMDLHEDQETDPGDCECTFFWMNVDRSAENEWIRLSTYATGNMNDYDDDEGLGDGEMGFSGAVFDFYVRHDQAFTVRSNGYDQDCLDDHFGNHSFNIGTFLDCYLAAAFELNPGDNDDYAQITASFGPPGYGVGAQDVTASGQYELEFTIEEIPLAAGEDTADLRLTKLCKPDATALAGQAFTCTVLVDNLGPGLPRGVIVEDTLLTNVDPGDYSMTTPRFTIGGGLTGASTPCTVTTPKQQFTCDLGSVPIGGRATITTAITSSEGGDFNNEARVSTKSTDPNLANNQAIDGLSVIPVSDLSIAQASAPSPVVAGTILTYTLHAANNGPSTAANALVEDILPAGVSILSVNASGGASCNAGVPGDSLRPTSCAFDSLAPLESGSMTIVVSVRPDTIGPIHNDTRVSSASLDTNNSNNYATGATQVDAAADISITKTASPASVVPGQPLTYKLTVANDGPSLARNVTVTDTLPSVVHLTSTTIASGGGVCALLAVPSNTVSCYLSNLEPGASLVIYLDVLVDASAPGNAVITNSAVVSSSANDPNPANNSSLVQTTVHAVADLSITKTSDSDIYKPSSTVQYIITVTNNGTSDAQGVMVRDNLPDVKQAEYVFDTADCTKSGLTLTCNLGTIPAGSSASFHVYVRIKGSRGEVSNTVSVTSATADPNLANNSATWVVLIKGGV